VETELELSVARLLAPIEPPTIRDFSVFEQHIEGAIKTGGDPDAPVPSVWYEMPFCYFSNPHAITGPDDDIRMAPGTKAQDLELEVAAVICRSGRNVRPQDAGAYIGGYTIFNDWSARDIGGKEAQTPFGQCKGKDFANTLGPWIVTPDELEPWRDGDRYDVDMRATINGSQLGGDTLANMAWSFEEMVAYAARGAWIRPGDVLGSGTCGGGCLLEHWGRNGSFADPPPLRPGDEVVLSVEGIGTLRNRVVEGDPFVPLPPARPGRLRARAGR
jgi:2-keto-4-pentenoate hydratase/2-oxohepta-3-ene-1,7-dioic acid hydratase in catechol pathway